MDKNKAKYIASIIELSILFILAIYLITKSVGKYFMKDVKRDYREKRQNPTFAFLGGFFGKSPFEVFNGIMGQKVTALFKRFAKLLTPIFTIIQKIFKIFQNNINKIRNLLMPIRDFFKAAAEKFYRSISKYVIGTIYSLNKIRNTMKRTSSGFNLIFHTLEHSKNSLQSMIKSPPVKIAMALMEPIDWIVDSSNKLFCFDAYTPLVGIDGGFKFIKDVVPGDILEDGSIIIATQKFRYTKIGNPLYIYRDTVLVTGEHKVYENNKWIYIKDSDNARLSNCEPEYIYCVTTSSGIINVYSYKFRDFSESNNRYLNYTINSLILSYLNGTNVDSTKYAAETSYLEHGFGEDTLVKTEDGLYKIKELVIGDKLENNNKVIGIVLLDTISFKFYQNSENIIVSSNTKVYENNLWKNVEKSVGYKQVEYYGKCYNIVTKSGFVQVNDRHRYLDYLESSNPILNRAIDNIIDQIID